MKSRTIIVACLLVMMMIACSLSGNTGGNPPDQESSVDENPASTPNPVPVSLNDGLASLNSYEMTVIFSSVGPDPAQSNTTTIKRQRSNDTNASYTSINTIAVSAVGGDSEKSDTSIYQIGNDQCSGSDTDEWSWTTSTPAEAEMQGLITGMIGLTPLIDNPVFVAAETVNGIPTNHFTFQVPGLGASSGAVVNINQGDYWLAVDGQYIVKYTLIVETSMAAESDVLHEEISIEVNQINQPVSIAFPQSCLDASQVTPEP
jgi:hypothetical protein